VESLKDKIDGYTESLAAEGILLGVAEPMSEDIDLSGTAFDLDAKLTVFLADAASVGDLGGAPIEGATVSVKNSTFGDLRLMEKGSGLYEGTSEGGLAYYPTQEYAITVDLGGLTHKMPGLAPYPANVEIPLEHEQNSPLDIDLSSFDYDAVLVSVVNLRTSAISFSNQPESIEEIYDLTHSDEEVLSFVVPGSAFSSESVFAVGIAGMFNAEVEDFVEMNTILSSFLLGQMKFYPVSTLRD
jgi:hypothetical protein